MTQVNYTDCLNSKEIYTNDSGEEFAYFNGLYRVAEEQIGILGWDTDVVQSPEYKNKWSATVTIKVYFKDGTFASGAADCRYDTAGDGFQNYTTALAETRAFARALRRKLRINLCSFEEQYTPANNPITDTQKNCIEKKFINNGLFTLEVVSNIVGREVNVLTELNSEEAAKAISGLNKLLKKKQLSKKEKEDA